jgi:hypothetical protein
MSGRGKSLASPCCAEETRVEKEAGITHEAFAAASSTFRIELSCYPSNFWT